MVMRSDYNGALVEAVTYTGDATTLTWEKQHELCAAAGRATPGSENEYWNPTDHPKHCAYSVDDNYVVADLCGWYDQGFTHVSGSLDSGSGYMCAGTDSRGDCFQKVRVEGTTTAPDISQVTLNSGDSVFCGIANPMVMRSLDGTMVQSVKYNLKSVISL